MKKSVQEPLLCLANISINTTLHLWNKSMSEQSENTVLLQRVLDKNVPGVLNIIISKQPDIILILFLFTYKAILIPPSLL